MTCPSCSHENRPGAKFCEECGAALERACASCGVELRPTAKFCDECGAAVAPGSAPRTREAGVAEARKVVTVAFADLVGSTALHERVDAESARRLMERYYETLRRVIESHGGTVVKLLGDGVMAAFGVPRVAEDDAIRAVRAGVAMQEAFRALVGEQGDALAEVGLRVAVNTGEVVVTGDNDDVVGDPVNVAARLQQEAGDGDVVVGEATRRLVASLVTLAPLGRVALKGRAGAVSAYRVVSLERPAGAPATPFVGRASELARLEAVYEAAIAGPAAGLAVLLGSAGLGKSRLVGEIGRRLGDEACLISASCDAAGEGTFTPLADALREFLEIDDTVAGDELRSAIASSLPNGDSESARIASGIAALVAGSPASPEETFFVVRRLLASLAERRPVLLVIDDLQWAEPLLLDLVEHLVEWGGGVRLFVLVSARPELRDARSSLATPGGLVADVVTLEGLDAGAATRLAAHVIGASDLPAAVAAKVLATSEGNPLFVGELVRMLVDEGVLERTGDGWAVGEGLASFEMPPTIHALLAARIERLRPEDRTVLERAAVVGRQFSRGSVAALVAIDTSELDARLEALRRSELIERDTGWFLGEPGLRFHHTLIRDAAYRRLLKETRADLHSRLADWIEERAGESIEHDETIGWHLEQAHRLLAELGPLDERGRALGTCAAERLSAAGRRALERDDVALAASLLRRALDRLDHADACRADLLLDGCEAMLAAGEVAPASGAIDELGRLAADSERLRAWHTSFVGQLTALTAPQELRATADAVAAAAEQLATLGDTAGEAKAHFVHAQALARLGRVGACESALDRALAAARQAGDRRRANAVLAGAPLAALWGPSPVTRASGRCLDVVRVLRITQGAPAVEAVALSCQGVLEALRGRTDAARRMIASSREMVEELGISHRLYETDVFAGRVDLLEGDAVAAERRLREAYNGLRDLRLGIDAARAAALLARALLAQDRAAEAEALSHESEALAGDDLQAAIAWRGVRAEALARRGDTETAIDLARRAVEIASATDALLDHADARLALAAALRAAGRDAEADAEEREAVALWETKGATLLAERDGRERGPESLSANVVESAPTEPAAGSARLDPHASARTTRDPVRRRVRANAVTRSFERFQAALAERDADALGELFGESLRVVHHPSAATYGRREMLATWRSAMKAGHLEFREDVLATLGETLALERHLVTVEGLSEAHLTEFGRSEFHEIALVETDDRGTWIHTEIFDATQLHRAIVRLYQLHAERTPEGAAHERAVMSAQAVEIGVAPSQAVHLPHALAPDIELVDHRVLGTWNAHGIDAALTQLQSIAEVADDVVLRTDDVLALQPDAWVARRTHSGTDRRGGGQYERPFVSLAGCDEKGRLERLEWFDADRPDQALARLDELYGACARTASPESTERAFENAATRLIERFQRAWEARDWNGILALQEPGVYYEDRRRLMQLNLAGESALAQLRVLFDVPGSRWTVSPLATRGERIALSRVVFEGNVDERGGTLAIEYLAIGEAADADHIRGLVLFDLEDLDAAYAELDARWLARESGTDREVVKLVLTGFDRPRMRDWSALAERLAPDFRSRDHRLLGWGTTISDAATFVRAQQALIELAPDARYRIDHVRVRGRVCLLESVQEGTREGGRFENPMLAVLEYDEDGRTVSMEVYDTAQLEQARARFEELGASNDGGAAAGGSR